MGSTLSQEEQLLQKIEVCLFDVNHERCDCIPHIKAYRDAARREGAQFVLDEANASIRHAREEAGLPETEMGECNRCGSKSAIFNGRCLGCSMGMTP